MKLITVPISHNQTGSVAVNLIECILFLIGKNLIKIYDAPNQPTQDEINALIAGAKLELVEQVYGENAQRVVLYFQLQNGLGDQLRGAVDDKTAVLLNQLLQEYGAFNTEKVFVVTGVVTDSITGEGSAVSIVKVLAYDKDMYGKENLLGETFTDKEGYYKIEYTEEHFKRTDKEKGGPDLIVRILDDKGTIIASSRKINNAKAYETVNLEIGKPPFIVRGLVTENGKPLVGVLVTAYDKDLRRKEWLGEDITNATGNYEITYSRESFISSESAAADLIIEVSNTTKKLLGASPVFFNVAREQVINLALQKSEWEQLNDALLPLLEEQKQSDIKTGILLSNLPPAELLLSDIQFLANDTGRNEEQIRLWALAYKNEIKIDSISADAFYAWYQQGLPEELVRLWDIGVEKLIDFLQEAIAKNIITKKDDAWFSMLREKINGLLVSSKL